jgi:hypothetical protein
MDANFVGVPAKSWHQSMAILTKMDSQKTSNLNLESCPETSHVILNLFQDQDLKTSEFRFYLQGK